MNRFVAPSISFLAIMIAAALVVQLSVRTQKLKPDAEISSGQIIYSVNLATQCPQPVVTGYRVATTMTPKIEALNDGTNKTDTVRCNEKPAQRRQMFTLNGVATTEPRNSSQAAKKNPVPELLNPYIIEKIIQQSDKTYYFTEKSLTRSGVTVELLSMTPRRDDYFLKFKVINANKKEHFIPQAFAVRHGNDWVDVEKFFPKYLVEGGQDVIGYLRVKAPYSTSSAKERVFQLNESGGLFRKYSIFY